MPTVAEQLRLTREKKNLTVYQVAEITKIKTDHIRALDQGDYGVFAAPVYVRGFVRTYASLLKLDVPALMAALDEELAVDDKHSEPPSLAPHGGGVLDFLMLQLSRLNWRIALAVLVVLVLALGSLLGYRAWRTHQTEDPLSNLGPGVYQPARPPAGDTLPLPAAPARK